MTFEEFKNKHFGGDETTAIGMLAFEIYNENFYYSENSQTLDSIMKTLDKNQQRVYLDFLTEAIKDNPKRFNDDINILGTLEKAGYDPDRHGDIQTFENPYKSRLLKTALKAVVGFAVIAVAAWVATWLGYTDIVQNYLGYVIGVFGAYLSWDIVDGLHKLCAFNKAKKGYSKLIDEQKQNSGTDKKEISLTYLNKIAQIKDTLKTDKCDSDNIKKVRYTETLEKLMNETEIKAVGFNVLTVVFSILFVLVNVIVNILTEASITAKVLVVGIFLAILVVIVIGGVRNRAKLRKIKNKEFYIKKDVCRSKTYTYDEDTGWGSITVELESSTRWKLSFQKRSYDVRLADELNDTLEEGVGVYVLVLDGVKKPLALFSDSKYIISEDEFKFENGVYCPI